jgi:hypothetical protein
MLKVSSRLCLAILLLVLAFAGCRSRQGTETNSARPSETNTQPSNQSAEKPAFAGKIENLSLYPVPNRPENLAVSLVVSVTNDGAAGNAGDWTLAVYAPGRFDLRGLQPVHVNGVVTMPGASGKRVDLDREDLAVKSKDAVVNRGETLTGILTFILAKTAASDISNSNTSIVLHFKDSQGNSYQTGKATVGAKR